MIVKGQLGNVKFKYDDAEFEINKRVGTGSFLRYIGDGSKPVVIPPELTSCAWMFSGRKGLTGLDLSRMDTSKVTSFATMFAGSSLKQVDMSSLDTTSLVHIWNMFYNCFQLEKVVLPNLMSSKVTEFVSVFRNCKSIKELDLTGIDFSRIDKMDSMIEGCTSLERCIVASEEDRKRVIKETGFKNVVVKPDGEVGKNSKRPARKSETSRDIWSVYSAVMKEVAINWEGASESEARKIAYKLGNNYEDFVREKNDIFWSMYIFCKEFLVNAQFVNTSINITEKDIEEIFKAEFTKDMKDKFFVHYKECLKGLSKTEFYVCVLRALNAVHNKWITLNAKKFLDPARQDRQYMFLPLSNFGTGRANGRDKFKDVRADLIFGEPLLEALGFEINLNDLREFYRMRMYSDLPESPSDLSYNMACFLNNLGDYPYKWEVINSIDTSVAYRIYRQIYG